jgi:C-terminal processing protease CtpA/Prc
MVRVSIISILFIVQSLTAQTNQNAHLKPKKESNEGFWESDGYGRVIQITNKEFIVYDISKVNCTKGMVMPYEMVDNNFTIRRTSDSTLIAQEGFNILHFKRIDRLPKGCFDNKNKKDALHNFEALWHTFNENYCYFKERKTDWNALKSKYQSQINTHTKPYDLFLLLNKMIKELNDGHSRIEVPKKLRKEYNKYKKEQRNIRLLKLDEKTRKEVENLSLNVDEIKLKTIKKYVKYVKTYNFGALNYGLINKDVAIIQVNGMDGFANYNIPKEYSKSKAEKMYEKSSNKSKNYPSDNVKGTAYILDKVLLEIKDTKACIIDIRFNGGGFDRVGLEILKRFATKDTLIFSKRARSINGFTKKQNVYLKPLKNVYRGNVYLLTSSYTASAAEGFILAAMSALPNAIRVGSNTAGVFSDMLVKRLPNGWEYSLSNEIYESSDGVSYEAIGIPPHYNIEYPKKGYWFFKKFYDNNTDKDDAIEKVFELEKMN